MYSKLDKGNFKFNLIVTCHSLASGDMEKRFRAQPEHEMVFEISSLSRLIFVLSFSCYLGKIAIGLFDVIYLYVYACPIPINYANGAREIRGLG